MIKIKSKADIESMREAGRISAKVLRLVGARVAPGVSTLELDELAESIIRLEGAVPAFKGYGGFPGSICASVNDAVVHGIPSASKILQEGDIISIDTGAIIDGWVGDNAWTFPVGKISADKQRLLDTTEACMWAAIDAARAGNHLGDVGYACQTIAEEAGYGVVREYVGHGIGHEMHEDPAVPNFGSPHSGPKLKPGMVFAIEPMINMGTHRIVDGEDGWLVSTADGLSSAHFEKTVAICDGEPIFLTVEPEFKRPVNG